MDFFLYLGIWCNKRLTWKTHIGEITEKCKRVLNILRYLKGSEWGAEWTALKALYKGLIRSVLVCGSAAKTLLNSFKLKFCIRR